jgi:SAM-dependent methyltransferase
MKTKELEFHPIASIFPLMEPEGFNDLKEDIEINGMHEPVRLYEGKILDGRNRYNACKELKIEPHYREFEPVNSVDPFDFVVSMNLMRRHLSASQKAMAAVDALPFYKKQAESRKKSTLKHVGVDGEKIPPQEKGKSRDIVGEKFGVNGKYVDQARLINEYSPDLADEVRNGKKTLPKALSEMKRHQRIVKLKKVAKTYDPNECIEIFNADFYDYCQDNLDKNSVDLIVTDPPYAKNDLHLYDKLGETAKRVLKPGSFCIVYSGQYFLPQAMKRLQKHLEYHWMYCLSFKRNGRNYSDKYVINRWKAILIYYKGPKCRSVQTSVDFIANSSKHKDLHEWQQNVDGFEHLINAFSKPGDLVLDPMCGTGTSIAVCKELNREAVGIDIDEKAIEICKGRIFKKA